MQGLETVPKINLQCTCTGQILSRNDSTTLVQGQVAKVAVALGVTEEWGNLVTVARFQHEGSLAIYDIEVDENYEVEVPHEMTDDAGIFSMSLKGEGDNRVITSSPVTFNVISTITGKGKTSEPTETILDRFSKASKIAEESAASAKSYAASAETSKISAASSETKAKTYLESAKSSETSASESAAKSQALLDEAKRLDRFHVNYLTKTVSDDSFVHVEDAFEGGRIRGFTIQGKCEQITTKGINLWPQIESLKMDGVTFEPYADRHGHADRGMVKVSGTATLDNRYASVTVNLEAGTYSFKNFGFYKGSSASDAGAVYLRVRVGSDSYIALTNEVTSFTLSSASEVSLDIMCGKAGSVGVGAVIPMLVKGSMPSNWEQYTGGKPSPSPEYPQEIDVAESVKLATIGRNIFKNVSSDIYYYIANRASIAVYGKTVTLAVCNETSENNEVHYIIGVPEFNDNNMRKVAKVNAKSCVSLVGFGTSYITEQAKLKINKIGWLSHTGATVTNPAVYVGNNALDYREYIESFVSIPLPKEHPYLASLPDGTHDEITVDETGHAVLTARVGKTTLNGMTPYNAGAYYKPYPLAAKGRTASMTSVAVDNVSLGYASPTWRNSVVESSIILGDGDVFDVAAYNAIKSAEVYFQLATPVTYDLGYVDLPSQPDRYCNFWVDTGDTGTSPTCPIEVTYERDVNIVIEDLENRLSS